MLRLAAATPAAASPPIFVSQNPCSHRPPSTSASYSTCFQIPSDNVPFNELPDMKATEITAAGREALLSRKFDMVRINYANPDMVGYCSFVPVFTASAESSHTPSSHPAGAHRSCRGRHPRQRHLYLLMSVRQCCALLPAHAPFPSPLLAGLTEGFAGLVPLVMCFASVC